MSIRVSSNSGRRQSVKRPTLPIQGTSADIIKLAMLRVDRALAEQNLSAQMVLQVHDELLFECPEEDVPQLARLVRTAMEGAYPLDVPLRVEVKSGLNWWLVTPLEDDESDPMMEEMAEAINV